MKPMRAITIFSLTLSCLLQSQVPAAFILTEKPKVTSLFRGTHLDHWDPVYEDGWIIEDSHALTPSGKNLKRNYLWTKDSYGDFILTLQYKLSEGTNSGIFFRADPSDPVQKGIEIQLLDGPSKHATDGKLDKRSNGAIYDLVQPSEYNNRPAGQWNSLLLYVRGSFVAVYVNGNQVATAELNRWTHAGVNPDGTKHKFKNPISKLPHSGKIGLQDHGKPVWFRGISLTELDEYSPDLTQVTPRRPQSEADLRYWLKNMIEYHNYSDSEVKLATSLSLKEIRQARKRYNIHPEPGRSYKPGTPLTVLPYPGGRHPRIGFLDGAIDPQRETKLSVFLPWDPTAYAVIDVPEAIVSNLGLMYLAHIHFPSIWTKIGVELAPLEWQRNADGSFELTRVLPNDISYTAKAVPTSEAIHMYLSLTNGTSQTLTDMRVQNCVMLRGAPEFADLTTDNKVLTNPYTAVHNPGKDRWMITAWEQCHNPWSNPNCPCFHSDPRLPDCRPGETVSITGIFSLYEGTDIEGEFARLDSTSWQNYFNSLNQ